MKILEAFFVASLCLALTFTQDDDVRLPPSIIRGPPRNLIYRNGDNVKLECIGNGVPDVRYEWKKNGQSLQNIHRGADGAITIQSATSIDEGFYQCFARNRYGTALTNTTHLQRAFLDSTVGNTTNVLNKIIQVERSFHIPCDPRRSFPKPTYIWEIANGPEEKNPIEFVSTERIQISENGDLHFAFALPEDELGGRLYRCTTYNPYLDVKAGGSYIQLTVIRHTTTMITTVSPSIDERTTTAIVTSEVTTREAITTSTEATTAASTTDGHGGRTYQSTTTTPYPTTTILTMQGTTTAIIRGTPSLDRRRRSLRPMGFFSESPIVAVVGRSETLRCFFYVNPVPTISWLGPQDTLPTGRYMLNNFNTTLTINNITASNEGNYSCAGSNAQKSFWFIIGMRVEEVPLFPTVKDAPYDVNVTEGESFTFNCNPVAKPVAKIVWLQDGKALDPKNPPERFVFSNDLKSLTIRNVCRDCVDRESKTDLMVIQCNASNVHGYAFGQGYLNVLHKYCDNELDENHLIQWNRTLPGKEIFRPCPGNTTGSCSRECFLNATWSQPNFNGCFDNEFKELLERVKDLKNQTVVIAEIASQLSVLTNKSEGLKPGNLNASVMIINRLAILRRGGTDNPTISEIESFVQATSNVLRPINSNAWTELRKVNATFASIILFSVDVYGRSLSLLNLSNCTKKDSDNLVVEAWSLENSSLPLQPEFPSCSVWHETSGYRISISREALTSRNSSESQSTFNLWGSYYRTINDYLPGNKDFGIINSKVLSLSVNGLKPEQKLKPPVLITLQHNQEKSLSFRRTCAFWNFNRKDWDSTGCSVTSTSLTHTICSCDHLTNFAILMSTTPSYDNALSILSYIGCSISIVALILTIIVYAVTWKQSKSAQATVLLNLCVALIIAYIIFIVGAHKVNKSGDYDYNPDKTPEGGCRAVAVLLHYFFLAAFFIMLAEGVELLIYIIFVFHVRRTIETVMLIASAWVLPLIVVGVSLGSTQLKGYGHEQACWLSVENGLIWAFVGPVLGIITVNFVILAIVLRWMSKRRSFLANNLEKRDEIRATLWNLSVTCPVLGLGWLFGVFSLIFDHAFFQYLFVMANSLQGLLIFIFHALFHNKKVKETISDFCSNYICGCRKTVYEVSDKMSATQELAKKTDKPSLVPMAVHDNKGMEGKDNLHSTGTQNTSIDDSATLESTH